jgi:hypothetical protein
LVQCSHCSKWLHASCLEKRASRDAQDKTTQFQKSKNRRLPGKRNKADGVDSTTTPKFEERLIASDTNKTRLTIIDKRKGQDNLQWDVDIFCLNCEEIIEKAGDESPEERISQTPIPQTPIPQTLIPQAPIPQAPIPQAPIPQAPIPQAPIPQAPIPQAPVARMVNHVSKDEDSNKLARTNTSYVGKPRSIDKPEDKAVSAASKAWMDLILRRCTEAESSTITP